MLAASLWLGSLAGQGAFPIAAEGFDSHVELVWEKPAGMNPASYKIWRSANGQSFEHLATLTKTRFIDFTGFPGSSPFAYTYYVSALDGINVPLAASDTITTLVAELDEDALLDMVQRYTFRYFWDFAHPVSGLARERNTSGNIVTTGGSGFGIMAILVGIERGFISRQQGLTRLLQIVSFLQFADRFHGVFPHWMNGNTGDVVPFSQFDNGGDLVETAFLFQGLLCARQFFNLNDPLEDALRTAITQLWQDVEWSFYRKNNSNVLYWHWSPDYGWQMNFPVRGFNEAMMVYILAIASPTHPVPASLWNTGWVSQNYVNGLTWFGYPLAVGPGTGGPLFFAHYSFIGFDPRHKKDAYANYFVRNRNHTLINRAYCIANPKNHQGYSEVCWGLTASDNPWGYAAHEATGSADNGTIAPTAALSSMPYTPAESLAALKHFYRVLGKRLWGEMGFFDAFHLGQDWFASSYLAIDQGPIICMIENYRTGLLWNLFMANPEIQPALDAIGFSPDVSTLSTDTQAAPFWSVYPNPASAALNVEVFFEKKQNLTLQIIDLHGRVAKRLFDKTTFPAGHHRLPLATGELVPGVYFLHLESEAGAGSKKIVIER